MKYLYAAPFLALFFTTACVAPEGAGEDESDSPGDDPDDDPVPASGGADGSGGALIGTGGGAATGGGVGTGGAPATGGGSGSVGCAGAEFCDDFEGSIDAAWLVQKDSVPAPALDTTKAHSGTGSMKVKNSSSQSFLAYPVPAQKFYARAYVNFSKGTADVTGHAWYIVATDNVTQGEENQIRFGASSNHGHPELDMNVYAGTCSGEKTQFSDGGTDGNGGWNNTTTDPVLLSADTWYCVEILFDSVAHESRVWINDTELTGLHVTETSMCSAWAPPYTHIKFGAGSNGDDSDIWYDDVAVSTNPIGCD
jgi:hypothetical protein